MTRSLPFSSSNCKRVLIDAQDTTIASSSMRYNDASVAFSSPCPTSRSRTGHLNNILLRSTCRRPRFLGVSLPARRSSPFRNHRSNSTRCSAKQSLPIELSGAPGTNRNTVDTLAKSPTLLTSFSSFIGVLVLIGSLFYKVPQIVRIVRRRSARGISVLYYALETLGMTFSAVYFARRSFPFVTYGETLFIMFTNVIILSLMWKYERFLPLRSALLSALCFLALLLFLFSPTAPLSLLVTLQIISIPLLNMAKIPQILLNHSRKDTGELAPITLGVQLLGNAARIFTTLAQVKDVLMLSSTLVAFCFNTALFGQWIYYSRRKPAIPMTE